MFNERLPVVIVCLDLTIRQLVTDEVVARIEAVGTGPARFMRELMDFFVKAYKDAQGFEYPSVHDSCAVPYFIDLSIITTRKVPVNIELEGALTLGTTVPDFCGTAPSSCHTSVAVELDY